MIAEYNKQTEKPKIRTVDKPYKSVLSLTVKRGVSTLDPDFDIKKCWYCQEFERIQTPQMSKIWCLRCWRLVNTKHDGTVVDQNLKGIGSDLAEVQQKLKDGKMKYEDYKSGKYEEEVPIV